MANDAMKVNIYKIYAAVTAADPICCTMAEGPVEAVEMVRANDWARMQLTCTAYAERVEEN
jgi:hypothetical protein